jgi:hypothetical protein
MGWRVDGVDKLAYNHFDSYPGGLGLTVLSWLRAELVGPGAADRLAAKARELEVVRQGDLPTTARQLAVTGAEVPANRLDAELAARRLRGEEPAEWYERLREDQGDPEAMLRRGVLLDDAAFIRDSLFCEWAYVVNCDDRTLEVYRGFQSRRHRRGRYAASKPKPKGWKPSYDGENYYYPCALRHAFPFDSLPTDEAFLAAFQQEGD